MMLSLRSIVRNIAGLRVMLPMWRIVELSICFAALFTLLRVLIELYYTLTGSNDQNSLSSVSFILQTVYAQIVYMTALNI